MNPAWLREWLAHLYTTGPRMSDAELEACARLAIVLLCGEQSAIQVFSAEVRRGRASADALAALRGIEDDELLHEQALLRFCTYLPAPGDGHALKRRAQRFFAGLGRNENMARHFSQIAVLDGAVCRIMAAIETSEIDAVSPLRLLATRIKQDEARHVAVSRSYTAALGIGVIRRNDMQQELLAGLVEMLEPLAPSFETVGVDSDKLFARINRSL
jgi:hypothetical protein